ncbi:MAG: methyl-accepting chemotaxis protein [Spirochaeta sp.]
MSSIRRKITVSNISPIILFLLLIMFSILPTLRTQIYQAKEVQTRDMVTTAIGVLEHFYRLQQSGELTRDEAQQQAAAAIASMTFGPDRQDYFWINDYHPRMIMHPFRPDMEGQDLSGFEDPDGLRLFQAMVDTVQADGSGHVEYQWQYYDQQERIEPKISYVAGFEPWQWIVGTGVYINDVGEIVASARLSILLWLALILAAAALLGMLLARMIANPVKRMTGILKTMAQGQGDLTVRLPVQTKDELGSMADFFNQFISSLAELIREIRTAAGQLSEFGEKLHAGMSETASAVTQITANIDSSQRNVTDQSAIVIEVTSTIEQISRNIESLNSRIEDQAASVTQASSAVEQMVANTRSITSSLQNNAAGIQQLRAAAGSGRTRIGSVTTLAQSIVQQSEGLQEANEAAHAGEHGRGFAVVADEIRKLAENSARQSRSISQVLKTLKGSIDQVAGASSEAEQGFEQINTVVSSVANQELEIQHAMEENSAGSTQVLQALSQINQITTEVNDGSSEILTGSQAIVDEMIRLSQISSEIDAGMKEMTGGAQEISAAMQQVADMTGSNTRQIGRITSLVGRFSIDTSDSPE